MVPSEGARREERRRGRRPPLPRRRLPPLRWPGAPARRRRAPCWPPRAPRGSRACFALRSRRSPVDRPRGRARSGLRECLHLEELARGDRVGDLVGARSRGQVPDAAFVDHHLDRGNTAAADARQQALADDAPQNAGEDRANLLLLARGEELDQAAEGLGGIDRVQGREDEVAGLCGLERGLALSASRSSPIRITSGSWRSTRRAPARKLSVSRPTSRWLTMQLGRGAGSRSGPRS